jgi:prolyl-tRNA synthetase
LEKIPGLLDEIQENLFQKAKKFRAENISEAGDFDEFRKIIKAKGGFVWAHWDGTPETEQKIKEKTKATIRLIPLESDGEQGKCVFSGKPSEQKVLFAKAY